MNPTAEQAAIADAYVRGTRRMVIQARAGTGKTTTLRYLAEVAEHRRILYMAFNKAVVEDAKAAMPRNVRCYTAHALAFRDVGKAYQHRFKSARMPSAQIARILGIHSHTVTNTHGASTLLQPAALAGMVMAAVQRFTMTADPTITVDHVMAMEALDDAGNADLARHLFPFMEAAWADLTDVDGRLRYFQGAYLKQWQLTHP
ncbi:MAG: AAA family ATPase, partial [Actinomycetota bacterium]|nr:AAA family ATPase [Actinomycetota bacterium]